MADNAETRAAARRAGWTLEVFQSFEEAETATRAYWHAATPLERLEAAELIRRIVWGSKLANGRVERVLEVVSSDEARLL